MLNALERAIPPPTNNKTPHGILLAVSQLHALLFFLIGIINKRSAPNNPIEVSLIFKSKLLLINLLSQLQQAMKLKKLFLKELIKNSFL